MSQLLPGVFRVDGAGRPGMPGSLNVCLLVAENGEITLVDTAFPGILEPLRATLAETGVPNPSVRRIIITHHHPDHTGGIAEVVAEWGCDVWAHRDDAPLISAAKSPGGVANAEGGQVVGPPRIDLQLAGFEVLDVLGGCHILPTPGHTPGHLSLFLPERSLLIAGDIVRYENGVVTRAPEMYTADPERSEQSLQQLAQLDFEHLLPYHGDFLAQGAGARLRHDLELGEGR